LLSTLTIRAVPKILPDVLFVFQNSEVNKTKSAFK